MSKRSSPQIGLRKGKKKAIHIPGEITQTQGRDPYVVKIEKSLSGGSLCTLKTDLKMEKGPVWLTIAPVKEGKKEKGSSLKIIKIKSHTTKQVEVTFLSERGPLKKAVLILDNRGRTLNLLEGRYYDLNVFSPEFFFSHYERKSIPVGEKGRSEPDIMGKERIQLFGRYSQLVGGGRVLDCATGIKDYLKHLAKKDAKIVCLNLSLPMLKRTREWLSYDKASFVRYDADAGFPFKANAFDAVIMDALLEYTLNPERVIKDAGNLVKPGGRLLFLEPVEIKNPQDFYPQDLWEAAIWRPIVDRSFSKKNFEKILQGTGFKLLHRIEIKFSYKIFEEAKLIQSIAVLEKLFI